MDPRTLPSSSTNSALDDFFNYFASTHVERSNPPKLQGSPRYTQQSYFRATIMADSHSPREQDKLAPIPKGISSRHNMKTGRTSNTAGKQAHMSRNAPSQDASSPRHPNPPPSTSRPKPPSSPPSGASANCSPALFAPLPLRRTPLSIHAWRRSSGAPTLRARAIDLWSSR